MTPERPAKTLLVAAGVAVFCSLMVSAAIVYLRPAQVAWEEIARSRTVLSLAGLLPEGASAPDRMVAMRFRELEVLVADLQRGQFDDAFDGLSFDMDAAWADPAMLTDIPRASDLARLGQRPRWMPVYLRMEAGAIRAVVLPIRGQGMWAPMQGYLALEGDFTTIVGIAIEQHGETPGIGERITDPAWQASWIGKRAFNEAGEVRIAAAGDGRVPRERAAQHTFDAISGATVTVSAVTDMVSYWLGGHGYGPLLQRLRTAGGQPP